MTKDRTRWINSESQVPEGWIPMATVASDDKTLKRALTDAHKDGTIDAVKLVRHQGDLKTGRVWMNPEHLDAFLASYRPLRRPASEQAAPAKRQGEELVLSLSRDIQELRTAMQNLQAAFELYVVQK